MIKGVNRKIIEISGMENDYFEKAVLYVRPDKSGASEARIDLEARAALCKIVPPRDSSSFCARMGISPAMFRLAVIILVLIMLLAIVYIIFC